MKTPNIASNLDASTNPGSVSNVVPKPGIIDYWKPLPGDLVPAIQVILPVVYGAKPESYELMEINIIAKDFDTVVVTVYNSAGGVILTVSFLVIGGGSYWAGRAAARPLLGPCGPPLYLARPLFRL